MQMMRDNWPFGKISNKIILTKFVMAWILYSNLIIPCDWVRTMSELLNRVPRFMIRGFIGDGLLYA